MLRESMPNNFIRGTQIFLHSIRMLVQSWRSMCKCLLPVFIISVIISFWNGTSSDARTIYVKTFQARLMLSSDLIFNKKTMVFNTPQGKKTIHAQAFLDNPVAHKVKARVHRQMLSSLGVGVMAFMVGLLGVSSIFSWKGRKTRDKKVLRGAKVMSPNALAKEIRNKKLASEFMLAGVPLVKGSEKENTLIIGGKGKGKTTCILELLKQLRSKSEKALVYDDKGTYVSRFYRPGIDIILNPLDARTENWDMWSDVTCSADFAAQAHALLPDSLSGSDSHYWIASARTVFAAACQKLYKEKSCSMQALLNPMFSDPSSTEGLSSLIKGTIAESLLSDKIQSTALCIKSTLVAHCKSLMYLKDTKRESSNFSIRKWLEDDNDKRWVFISVVDKMNYTTLRPLISLWLDIVARSMLSLPENYKRRVWIIFDEFCSANRLPSIEMLLSEGREYGASTIIGFQDKAQLTYAYGRDRAEGMLSLFNTSLFFGTNNKDTAQWMASKLGERELLETREGLSYGAHQMRDGVNLSQERRVETMVMPIELMNLDKLQAYIVNSGSFPSAKLKFKPRKDVAVQPPIVERRDVDLFSIGAEIESHEHALQESEAQARKKEEEGGKQLEVTNKGETASSNCKTKTNRSPAKDLMDKVYTETRADEREPLSVNVGEP